MFRKVGVLLILVGLSWACSNDCTQGAICGDHNIIAPSGTPTPPPPLPGATPDPCIAPVTGVDLSGPVTVLVGDVFLVDVTPISSSGRLEGPLSYCNERGRKPEVVSTSVNVRQVGSSSAYRPQFQALAVGPFSIRIRVDNVTAEFSGTISKVSLLDPCKKFICPDPGATPGPTPRPEATPTPTPKGAPRG